MTRYSDIIDTLRREIENGKYSGTRFPGVVSIRRRFGVAHMTAVRIIDGLKRQGLVFSRRGSGTFVRKCPLRRVGVMVPVPTEGEFYPYISKVISKICATVDHCVLLADIPQAPAKNIRSRVMEQAKSLVSERVSGVLYHPIEFIDASEDVNNEALGLFRSAGIPVVLIDSDSKHDSVDQIGIDNVQIGWRLAEHVVERGARRILFACRELETGRRSPNAHQRLLGVRDFAAEHPKAVLVGECGICSKGRNSLSSALRRNKPDAVICVSDYAAALAMKVISVSGRRVPDDVLVTGVNDIGSAALLSPSLTTVRQQCEEIAMAALETLEWRAGHPSAAPRRILVSAPLVVRESTKPLKRK